MNKIDAKKELKNAMKDAMIEAEAERKGMDKETYLKSPAKEFTPFYGSGIEVNGLTGIYRGRNMATQGVGLKFSNVRDKERFIKQTLDIFANASDPRYAMKAAMQEGTASEGGYLVPEEWANDIAKFAAVTSFAMRDCKIYNMNTDTIRIPTELTRITVAGGAEESELAASDSTFGEVTLNARRFGAYSTMSQELLDDQQYDLVSLLTEYYAEDLGQQVDNAVLNGGETFTGILSGAGTSTSSLAATGSASNAITFADVNSAITTLTSAKRQGAKFYLHKDVEGALRGTEDTAGSYVYDPSKGSDVFTLWGYPVEATAKLTDAATGGNAYGVFGNLKHYALGIRLNAINLEIDRYGLFKTYQVRARMVMRVSGKPLLPSALVVLKTAA